MAAIRKHQRRQALTLVEVLLVLSLLVVLASIAWPALDRPLATRKLRHAADALRTEWSRARNQAISTGQAVRFHYTLGDRTYSIVGDDEAEPSAAMDEGTAVPLALGGNTSTGPVLPEGITFASVETIDDGQASPGMASGDLALLSEAADEPLWFYPDGSTSTARVVLKNQHDRCIEVLLRGLTGVATLGEVFSAEEEGL